MTKRLAWSLIKEVFQVWEIRKVSVVHNAFFISKICFQKFRLYKAKIAKCGIKFSSQFGFEYICKRQNSISSSKIYNAMVTASQRTGINLITFIENKNCFV